MGMSYQLWLKLCNLYEQKNSASLAKVVGGLKMKDKIAMPSHLNEFNSIFGLINGQGIEFNNSLKALVLLIMLPKSWDTFKMTISNSANKDGSSTMVESNLLIGRIEYKEFGCYVNWKCIICL